jgi:electron transport complex protein RnfA
MSRAGSLAALAVFSGLSFNLLLYGLGLGGVAAGRAEKDRFPLLQTGISFVSVLVLWIILEGFSSVLGFFEYFIVFPAGAFVCHVLQYLFALLQKKKPFSRVFNSRTGYDGLAGASLFLARMLAADFFDALVLASGFTAGIMAVILVLREIRRRSLMEAVPVFLRGSPITLISMGLLSLIFSSVAAVLFRVLGG